MEKLSILIDSFDGYSDMWDVYFKIFNHYWPDCKYKIYLVNNNLVPNFQNVKIINTGKEIDWMTRTKKALCSIQTKYVLFSLEDYFIGKCVNNSDIDSILEYMDTNDINCYKMYPWPKSKKSFDNTKSFLKGYTKNDAYAVNGALAIFRTDWFIEILNNCKDAKSCFDFEFYYVKNNNNINSTIDFTKICYDDRDLLGYHNGIIRGKWLWSTLSYYKKENIDIDFSNREKMSFKQTFFYALRTNLPNWLRKILRKVVGTSSLGLK